LAQRRHDVFRALHQDIVLGDGQRDAGEVDLLEAVAADQVRGDLPRDADHRIESIIALAMPVTRLVAPGPEVAMHTPTPPEARA